MDHPPTPSTKPSLASDTVRDPHIWAICSRWPVSLSRSLVTVAEITTTTRGLAAEVPLGEDIGLDHESAVNCDGLHTVPQTMLAELVGTVDTDKMNEVCSAIVYAVACFADPTH